MKKYFKLLLNKEPIYRTAMLRDETGNRPRDLYDVMKYVASNVTTRSKYGAIQEGFLYPNRIIVSWAPNLFTFFLTQLKKSVFYLCWGVPSHTSSISGKLKYYKLRLILSKSNVVFVNDVQTQEDVIKMTGRHPIMLKYVVDNVYFSYASYIDRDDYVLVPGNNDRDEGLIGKLSNCGYKIIRLTRDSRVKDLYENRLKSHKVDVKFNVTVACVRSLYQNAKVVALPISSSNHAAGQTAILEAISCGTPVVLSSGRTGTIVDGFDSVILCDSNSQNEWASAIKRAMLIGDETPEILKKCSETIANFHSPEVVAASISEKINSYSVSQLDV